MPDKRFLVAFEIGSSKIKGAVGTVDKNGTLTVVAVEEEPLINSVRYGCIRKVPDVSDRILSITSKLEQHPSIAPGRIKGAYVPVSGITLRSASTQIIQRFDTETEITKEVIDRLKSQARSKAPEDRDVVAVMTRGYVVDTLPQDNPEGIFGHEIKADMSLIYCRPQIIGNLNRVFSERLPLAINGSIPLPLAQAALVLTDDEKNLGVMLVDFGAETTTVCIYKKETFRYLATIPMGSRNITRDLTSLNFTERRAEEIKKVCGNVAPDYNPAGQTFEGLDTTEINKIISERTGEIIANILAQLNYAGMKATDLPGGIVLVGGGANLKGFVSLLASHSGMKVRRGTPLGPIKKAGVSIKDTDSTDIISMLMVAANYPEKICVEFPEAIINTPEPQIEQPVAASVPTQPRGLETEKNDEKDPHEIKKPKKKSLLDRLLEKAQIILDDSSDMMEDDDNNKN